MTLFFVMTAWAFLEALQDPEPRARLFSPAVLFSSLREMMEIFLLTALGAGILTSAARFSAAPDFLAASGMLCFYLYGRIFKRRESFVWMAYAAAYFLRGPEFPQIAVQSAAIAAGVTAFRMILKGVQKRRFFSPLPPLFSGLPAFFVTAAIISLICSSLFVR